MFDIRLSAEQREFQQAARKFAQEEIKPTCMALDRESKWEDRIPWDALKKGSQLGFRTFVLQEECVRRPIRRERYPEERLNRTSRISRHCRSLKRDFPAT